MAVAIWGSNLNEAWLKCGVTFCFGVIVQKYCFVTILIICFLGESVDVLKCIDYRIVVSRGTQHIACGNGQDIVYIWAEYTCTKIGIGATVHNRSSEGCGHVQEIVKVSLFMLQLYTCSISW